MKTKDLAAIAMMTTLLVVLSYIPGIPLGFIPVPIVLQNLGVMLAGCLLGGKKGSLSVCLLFLVGLAIPAFSGFTTTIQVLIGPTAGYVWTWLLVPLLLDWGLSHLRKITALTSFIVIWLTGVFFVDLLGGLYLAVYTGMSIFTAVVSSSLAFIPGDSLKVLVATLVFLRFHKISASHKS
ncbi:biotin transporter BioY [Streptococcus tangpeifui]|uniref:biotin transporter BioY n=1 Tax=Streptococcus tangpeifui TaxID=2709400 RepID=UPI0013EE1109|nr:MULTISPECIES: biotin transporter BioY [unclassified Streptococcus]